MITPLSPMNMRIVLEGCARVDDGNVAWTLVAAGPALGVQRWTITTTPGRPARILDAHRATAESVGNPTTREPELDAALVAYINEELARVEMVQVLTSGPGAKGKTR